LICNTAIQVGDKGFLFTSNSEALATFHGNVDFLTGKASVGHYPNLAFSKANASVTEKICPSS